MAISRRGRLEGVLDVVDQSFGMPSHLPPAVNALREKRRHTSGAWSRLLIRPIRLHNGTLLFTLKDAADRILEMPASPSTRVAAERIIDAALRGGDMASTHAALRLALLKGAPVRPAPARDRAGD